MSYTDPDTAYESEKAPTPEMSKIVHEARKFIKAYEQGILSKEETGREILNASLGAMKKESPLDEHLEVVSTRELSAALIDQEQRTKDVLRNMNTADGFVVRDNGKLAKYPECKVDPSWDTCTFDSFAEAEEYAIKWLGSYAPAKGIIGLDNKYYYAGSEDYISIIPEDTRKILEDTRRLQEKENQPKCYGTQYSAGCEGCKFEAKCMAAYANIDIGD